jgi:hypothetical protein
MTAVGTAESDQRPYIAVHNPGGFRIKHNNTDGQRFATRMGVDVYYILPAPDTVLVHVGEGWRYDMV